MDTTGLKKYRTLIEYLGVTVGIVITALALALFLIPGKIASGGVSGLAIIIYHLVGLNVGMTMLVINIPLFIMGMLKLGGLKFVVKGLYGAVLLSLLTDLFTFFMTAPTQDPILATLYGGVLAGVGMGIVIYYGGTTGGTTLAAQLLQKYFNISVGQALLAFDALVIVFAGIAFSVEQALYAIIALLFTVKVVDLIQEGVGYAKAIFIISDESTQIAAEIMEGMDRGVTLLKGQGAYTGKERDTLLVVVGMTEISRLKSLVKRIDPGAFVIITNVNEAIGEGFKSLDHDK